VLGKNENAIFKFLKTTANPVCPFPPIFGCFCSVSWPHKRKRPCNWSVRSSIYSPHQRIGNHRDLVGRAVKINFVINWDWEIRVLTVSLIFWAAILDSF